MRENMEILWYRVKIKKVLSDEEKENMWEELVLMYDKYEEYDNAVIAMMKNKSEEWREGNLKEIIKKVDKIEI
jgi:clathrin heavy chain